MQELERQRVSRIALDHALQMQAEKHRFKARLMRHVATATLAGIVATAAIRAAAAAGFFP